MLLQENLRGHNTYVMALQAQDFVDSALAYIKNAKIR